MRASAWLPGLCSFPGRDFGLLTGKFDFIQLSARSVWTVSTDPLASFAMPCACVRMSDVSIWSVRGSPPLVDKSGITNMFAGLF